MPIALRRDAAIRVVSVVPAGRRWRGPRPGALEARLTLRGKVFYLL
jgi:hypothetical protein